MKSVVIIDDDKAVVKKLSALLKSYPEFIIVASAHTGREGKLAVEHYLPDFIILDIMMPDDDGLQVIKHIRTKCGPYNPFIYIITAVDTQLIRDIVADHKVDFFDFKPLVEKAVINKLEYVKMAKPKALDEHTSHSEMSKADIVDAVMAEFKIPSHLLGSDYIKTALYLMVDDSTLKRNIYSKVAAVYKCTDHSVLNAIKKAIGECTDSEAYRAEFGSHRVENLIFLNQLSSIIRTRLRGSEQ